MDRMKTRRAEQAEGTRGALVEAARTLFAERGYAGVGTEEIVAAARVTRGALYYHFEDKRDLFRTVFAEVDTELVQGIARVALEQPDPWQQLVAGCDAFLDSCVDPAIQRIVFLDAPSVLGWREWHEAGEAASALGVVEFGLNGGERGGRPADRQRARVRAPRARRAERGGHVHRPRRRPARAPGARSATSMLQLLEGLRARKVMQRAARRRRLPRHGSLRGRERPHPPPEPREVVVAGRRRHSSRSLLVASAVLVAIITFGGWSALQGAQIVSVVYIIVYLVMAYFVMRWTRGMLPLTAALAVGLAVFAAIAAPAWFARDEAELRRPGAAAARCSARSRSSRRSSR